MIRKRLKRRFNYGFTVTEMVMALSIAGVMASLAIPATGKLLDRYRLSNAISQVKNEVTRARMQAIGQNRWVRLKLTTAGIVREVSSDGTTYTTDGNASPLPTGVQVSWGFSGSPKFNRQGLAPNTTYVILYNSEGIKVLWINVLGRVDYV